jgi:hypothetical protein
MKLWQKNNTNTAALVEQFTVGRDKEFDLLLAKYDIVGSIAHVTMLGEVGIMTKEEAQLAVEGLNKILILTEEGKFKIEDGIEDVHSQVEKMLTEMIGEAGKKIHSGRSRNDQVATDIKLYLRAELNVIKELVVVLFNTLIEKTTIPEEQKSELINTYKEILDIIQVNNNQEEVLLQLGYDLEEGDARAAVAMNEEQWGIGARSECEKVERVEVVVAFGETGTVDANALKQFGFVVVYFLSDLFCHSVMNY